MRVRTRPFPSLLVALIAAAAMMAVTTAAMGTAGGAARAQTAEPLTFTGYVPRSGVSVVVMDRSGDPAAIVAALAGSGCVAQSIALAQRGAFLVYVVGAPAFTHAAFPTFLSPGSPVAIRCEPGPTTVAATTVTDFVPDRPAASTAQDGSCFTTSLALGARADAWRCTVDNSIYDPCFALADGAVVCGANPATAETGFLLTLTEPLPEPEISDAAVESATRNGWLVELEGGAVCGLNTGATGGINGERANYGCPDGEWIFGDLMPGTVWTGVLGTMTVGEEGFRLGRAREAVIRHVWR